MAVNLYGTAICVVQPFAWCNHLCGVVEGSWLSGGVFSYLMFQFGECREPCTAEQCERAVPAKENKVNFIN